MAGSDPHHSERQCFNKCSTTVLGKSMELAAKSGAKVYVLIVHLHGAYEYNLEKQALQDEEGLLSTKKSKACLIESEDWPPPASEVDRIYPNLERMNDNLKEFEVSHKRKLVILGKRRKVATQLRSETRRPKVVIPEAPNLVMSKRSGLFEKNERQQGQQARDTC
ncbi:hypothetical protein PRK78_006575 [Emydomyces testavorans]|uniref:Uncharacterized protein n=1 Tax=Emydomyces testavorans TaxID=2070801 RepID=A0AAF0DPF3_9EURO|nr:hypothetical protein PRK78_006575 [Emydomyces testavorans]